jgi:hypothetical protein
MPTWVVRSKTPNDKPVDVVKSLALIKSFVTNFEIGDEGGS